MRPLAAVAKANFVHGNSNTIFGQLCFDKKSFAKDGLYVARLKMPSGYKIAAHNHPTDEMVTVISGNLHIGRGDKLDQKKGVSLTSGGYAEAPAKMNHYAWTTSPTIIQVHGQGPFALTYVNPADDPSKK